MIDYKRAVEQQAALEEVKKERQMLNVELGLAKIAHKSPEAIRQIQAEIDKCDWKEELIQDGKFY